jgi:3-hydroxyanthranilate 3,4-dioxygenase
VGLVIERVRKPEHTDGLMWFCDHCNTRLHASFFHLENIEKDFLPRFKDYYADEQKRTCPNCHHVMETDPRFT